MLKELNEEQRNTRHGQIFFAKFAINQYIRRCPIVVLSSQHDKNEDVVICLCTTKGPKSEYDIEIQLKEKTYIRTNKIHTISRSQLLFKIEYMISSKENERIRDSVKKALELG